MAKSSIRTVTVPDGVEVSLNGAAVRVKGKHGELALELNDSKVKVSQDNGTLEVASRTKLRADQALAGTYQALLRNMVHGVTERWEKSLEIQGTGYRARAEKDNLNLMLGYSSPVDFPVPDGIEITTPTQTSIVVTGIDRQQVGQVAAEIRKLRPPEPYKGKGIRYLNEYVRRLEGKKT